MASSRTNAGLDTQRQYDERQLQHVGHAERGKANLTWSGCAFTATTIYGGTLEIHNLTGTVTASNFEVTNVVPTIEGNKSCTYETGKNHARRLPVDPALVSDLHADRMTEPSGKVLAILAS